MKSPGRTIAAAALIMAGAATTYDLFQPMDRRIGPPRLVGSFVLLGPAVLAAGAAMALAPRGAGKPATTDAAPAYRRSAVGIAMFLIGLLGLIAPSLSRGREQSWGMLGTIVFLLVGLPGAAVALVGLARARASARDRSAAMSDGP